MRSGMIGKKMGMSRHYTDDGRHIPVTILLVEGCRVVSQRRESKDGYTALQLGAGSRKAHRMSKALRGHFAKAKVEACHTLVEFRVEEDQLLDVGSVVPAEHFSVGQKVDVAGITQGKGFAGAMKRHGFAGLRASHGVSISHRSHGSTGQCQEPGKVFKGKKMAGHMGATRVTVQNLEIVAVDNERALVLVKGAVPGPRGSWVTIKDAHKAPQAGGPQADGMSA